MYLPLNRIFFDRGIYPRANPDGWYQHVERYADALRAGAEFPSILVGKSREGYVLIDGRLRTLAYEKAGRPRIAARATLAPRKMWFLEAVRLNVMNGEALSPQERFSAYARLKAQGLAEGVLVKTLGMPIEELENGILERGIAHLDCRDGDPVIAKAAMMRVIREKGKDWARAHAEQLDADQRVLSCLNHDQLITNLQKLLTKDLLPTDARTRAQVQTLYGAAGAWLQRNEVLVR